MSSKLYSTILILILFLILSCEFFKKNPDNNLDTSSDSVKISVQDITIEQEKFFPDTLLHSVKSYRNINNLEPVRGLYLSAYTIETSEFQNILNEIVSAGLNTVVFDLKNMKGELFFSTSQKRSLMHENIQPIINPSEVIKTLHGLNLRAVSRIVMFHDQFWASNQDDVRPQTVNGEPWIESERRGPSWLDPSHPQVQNYLLSLINEVASLGVDEIQLDYIRFPTQGNINNSVYYFQEEDRKYFAEDSTYTFRQKEDIITDFVARAYSLCNDHDVTLAADVFAIVSWQREKDISATGQNIRRLSQFLDSIHPMIYSSHFSNNFSFRENVRNEPYFLVYKAAKLTRLYSLPGCRVIPYIQANNYLVNYKRSYIYAQIEAINSLNLSGYLLWNSRNNYWSVLDWIENY